LAIFSHNLASRSAQTKGKKIYGRRRLFEKIKRVTAFGVHGEKPVRQHHAGMERVKA
jgi:hypothetical protein